MYRSGRSAPDEFLQAMRRFGVWGLLAVQDVGTSENRGTLFWGPSNKDPTISGTILGSPIFGNSHVV